MIKPIEKSELVYRFVVRYKVEHDGNSPPIRAICRGCHIKSTSHAYYLLGKLEDEKRLFIDPECGKIFIAGGAWTVRTIFDNVL